jgi:hypothetical protein
VRSEPNKKQHNEPIFFTNNSPGESRLPETPLCATREVWSLGRLGMDFWDVMGLGLLDRSEGYPSPTPATWERASVWWLFKPSSLKPRANFEFEDDSNWPEIFVEVWSWENLRAAIQHFRVSVRNERPWVESLSA